MRAITLLFFFCLLTSSSNLCAQESVILPASAPEPVSSPWQRLVNSRIQRQSSILDPAYWTTDLQSGLAMQEYLMTLGQNGEPENAARIKSFFTDPVLQGSALFAYGELDGADMGPLLTLNVRPENQLILAEALSKLAKPEQFEVLIPLWEKFPEDIKNRSLFFFWRNKTEVLTNKVMSVLQNNKDPDLTGYVYYLFRSRSIIGPELLTNILAQMRNNPQGLIYATRIQVNTGSSDLETAIVGLCSDSSWQVRVNALGALSRLGTKPQIERQGLAALGDENPNVVHAAIAMLLALENDKIDQKLAAGQDVFSNAMMYDLASGAIPARAAPFLKKTRSWEKSEDPWLRSRWLSTVSKLPVDEKLDKKLKKMLSGWRWEQGTPSEKALALDALIKRNPAMAEPEIKLAFESGDSLLMAVATQALSSWQKPLPVTLDELNRASTRFYVSTAFHQAYLGFMKSQMSESEWGEQLERLRRHPDYLVRLRALEATPDPQTEWRQSIYEKGWRHQIAPEIIETAAELLAGDSGSWFWQLETEKGPISIKLQSAYAPITCATIIYLTRQDYFNDMAFHRVIPNFVAQAGEKAGDGHGGPGFNIPCEINPLRFRKGAVGMAHAGKDSGGSQFFICHSEQPHLDGGHTLFGHVVKGFNLVGRIEEGTRILRATVERVDP